MKFLEWDVSEDTYQEQIIIPKKIRDMAAVDIKWNTYCFQSEYVKILIEKNQYIKT